MKKFLFIGIDFSQSKFDVSVLESIEQKEIKQSVFENSEQGYKDFLKWTSRQSKIKSKYWLFCGEHTGLYSRGLSNFLSRKKLTVWLENPLQIKRCTGMKRGKDDRLDSLYIAQYAIRYIDKLTPYLPASKEIDSLQLLTAHRSRLVKNKVQLEGSVREMRRVINRDETAKWIFESAQRDIERIKKKIQAIEEKMHSTIMNSVLKENYLLINSIKGVGMQTAVALMIHTNNFQNFKTARQIASYCGCVPFPNKSGTIDKGNHISRLANHEIKVLLTQCAVSAIRYNSEIMDYFHRKVAEGKYKRLVINNIRNKLIQRIFAVVTNKTPYRMDYRNPLQQSA
jgi:transposase